MISYVLRCYCHFKKPCKPHLNSAARGKITKMLSEFKITSLRDSSFTTRLGYNRIQNRTEPVPLTEIYESEIQRRRAENEFLKMQSNANAIQLNAALAQLHKKCDIANFTLVFVFKQNNDDKRNKSHREV